MIEWMEILIRILEKKSAYRVIISSIHAKSKMKNVEKCSG
jgi:hypothetical protein